MIVKIVKYQILSMQLKFFSENIMDNKNAVQFYY